MKNKKSVRVSIYCRVANNGLGDECAAQRQVEVLRAFAGSKGFTDCAEYVDNGYSGLSHDRPAFIRLNEAIRAGRIQAVIVKDEARLYRNVQSLHTWLEEMSGRGVAVHTPQENGGNV